MADINESDEKEQRRQRRLANLRPFSSTHQPKNRRSRKGIPNRSTIIKLYFKEAEKQERRAARAAAKAKLKKRQVTRKKRLSGSNEK